MRARFSEVLSTARAITCGQSSAASTDDLIYWICDWICDSAGSERTPGQGNSERPRLVVSLTYVARRNAKGSV